MRLFLWRRAPASAPFPRRVILRCGKSHHPARGVSQECTLRNRSRGTNGYLPRPRNSSSAAPPSRRDIASSRDRTGASVASRLRGGADDDLVHIDIGRLFDRERDRAGDRSWRHRELVPRGGELGLHLWICYAVREVRLDEARRNDRHAQLVAGLLPQTFGDGAHGELRAGIDRLVRHGLMSRRGSGVDKMPEALPAKTGSAAAMPYRTPLMLMSIISSQSSTRRSSRGETGMMPALLTRTSSLPTRSHASLTRLDKSSRRFTSVRA